MNIENSNLGSGGEGELRKNEGKYQQTYQITPLIRLSPEASPSAASAASFFMTFFNSVGSSLIVHLLWLDADCGNRKKQGLLRVRQVYLLHLGSSFLDLVLFQGWACSFCYRSRRS